MRHTACVTSIATLALSTSAPNGLSASQPQTRRNALRRERHRSYLATKAQHCEEKAAVGRCSLTSTKDRARGCRSRRPLRTEGASGAIATAVSATAVLDHPKVGFLKKSLPAARPPRNIKPAQQSLQRLGAAAARGAAVGLLKAGSASSGPSKGCSALPSAAFLTGPG